MLSVQGLQEALQGGPGGQGAALRLERVSGGRRAQSVAGAARGVASPTGRSLFPAEPHNPSRPALLQIVSSSAARLAAEEPAAASQAAAAAAEGAQPAAGETPIASAAAAAAAAKQQGLSAAPTIAKVLGFAGG